MTTYTPTIDSTDGPIWKPFIFDLTRLHDLARYEQLLAGNQVWDLHDQIERQVCDLWKTRNPKQAKQNGNPKALLHPTHGSMGSLVAKEYGRWVYYPWSGRLVHLLPPDEFRELRLDRNRNKITRLEQRRLESLTVGIAGLSVGNAVALTLSLEGVYGRLKLADFDELELSNMNRVRAGVHEISLPKVVITARQIYEIDPYANLELFPDGLTEQNLDAFLQGEQPLDILIDECDDIRMKFLMRERARSLGIPVLMETSDRGMMDVERFDKEPDRALFHGLTREIRGSELGVTLTNEEKVELVVPIVGAASLSARAAASMPEIEESLTTWPQLASEVALGGATVTTAVRRLGLQQNLPSGRRYVDIVDLLTGDERQLAVGPAKAFTSPPTHSTTDQSVSGSQSELGCIPELIQQLVSYAILAPSGGNSQPWRFQYDGEALSVLLDVKRSRNLFDAGSRGGYIALGAAIKNIEIAAAHLGYSVIIDGDNEGDEAPDPAFIPVARLHLISAPEQQKSSDAGLFDLLGRRMTNRKRSQRGLLRLSHSELLKSVACQYGYELRFVDADAQMQSLGDILGEGDQIRFLCTKLHDEMMSELRWTPQEAESSRDGLDVRGLELTRGQETVLQLLRRSEVSDFLREQQGGTRLREIACQSVMSASAVGLLSVAGSTSGDFVRGGRAIEHLWLLAQQLGYAWHPMTALIYMFDMLQSDGDAIFTPHERSSLARLHQQFNVHFPPQPGETRLMLFRLFSAEPASIRALRRPVNDVLGYRRPRC